MSEQVAGADAGTGTEELKTADAGAQAGSEGTAAVAGGGQGAAGEGSGAGEGSAGAGEAGKSAGEAEVEPTWHEDWRERMVAKLPAAEREKELARLRRFASPENVYRSFRETERLRSSGQLKPALSEGATPEEVAAFRKDHGIPETAEDYVGAIKLPEGTKLPPDAEAGFKAFASAMHAKNVPPAFAQEAFN